MRRTQALGMADAAVVRFAETLAEELEGTGIDVSPGALNTHRGLEQVLEAGGRASASRSTRARSSSSRARRQGRPRGAPGGQRCATTGLGSRAS